MEGTSCPQAFPCPLRFLVATSSSALLVSQACYTASQWPGNNTAMWPLPESMNQNRSSLRYLSQVFLHNKEKQANTETTQATRRWESELQIAKTETETRRDSGTRGNKNWDCVWEKNSTFLPSFQAHRHKDAVCKSLFLQSHLMPFPFYWSTSPSISAACRSWNQLNNYWESNITLSLQIKAYKIWQAKLKKNTKDTDRRTSLQVSQLPSNLVHGNSVQNTIWHS